MPTFSNLTPAGQRNIPVRRAKATGILPVARSDFDRTIREIEQLFDHFLALTALPVSGSTTDFVPSLDVHETEKDFQISLEVPGANEKDIDISISGDTLIISGEKKEEKEGDIRGIHRVERNYGSFSRSISLPQSCVDIDKAMAWYKNGVLTIWLPKTSGYKDAVRKIPIAPSATEPTKDSNGAPS